MSSSAALQERVFENKIPAHIPIKIKIKKEKEKSFKDLKNKSGSESWRSRLPIPGTSHFLYITLVTDVTHDGQRLVFPLPYGRPELGDIVSKAREDDVPIKPGETCVLQMGEWPSWEKGVREKRFPQATKVRAELQSLSFGDGTGYFGTHIEPRLKMLKEPKSAAGLGMCSSYGSKFG